MKIIISPNDVLLFREAKLFNAGEAHVARSILPVPQALAGAIRSKILVNSDFAATALIGYGEEEPAFELLGSFFHCKQHDYFRAPLDIAKSKDDESYFYITPRELIGVWEKEVALFGGKKLHTEAVNGFLKQKDMIDYLCGALNEENLNDAVVEPKKLFKREGRVGIKLGAAKTTEEGYFYKVEFLRLNKDAKLALWLGEKAKAVKSHIGAGGMLKLGGESRFANYELKEEELFGYYQLEWEECKKQINRDKRFKLYIATPTLVTEYEFLFRWDSVHRNGSERLWRFLVDDLKLDWARDAKMHIFNVGKTIRVFNDDNSVTIAIAEKKEKATIEINECKIRDLTVKKEDGTLNIYDKKFTGDIDHILKEKVGIEPVKIYPLLGKPYRISGWDYARKRPKENRYGVPEGSVYFITFEGEFNHDKPYINFGELNKLGYGLAFFAVWKSNERAGGDDRNV